MKRKLYKYTALVAILLFAVVLFAACGGGGSSTAKTVDPVSAFEAVGEAVSMPEMIQVPSDTILDYYGIDSADYTAAVFYISSDNLLADEFVIVNAVDADAAARIETRLKARLDAKAEQAEGYSPEQFAIIQGCSVRVDGLNVAMLVTPQFDEATKAYDALLK